MLFEDFKMHCGPYAGHVLSPVLVSAIELNQLQRGDEQLF